MRKNLQRFYLIIFSFLIFFTGTLKAQVASYSFTQAAGSYTSIGTGTQVHSASWDDNVASVTIPFPFVFNGSSYTSCSVNSNGYITFGSTISSTIGYNPISSSTGYAGAVSAMGRDLGNNGANINYTTLSSTPNRVFVVQWNNARRYNGATIVSGDILNFQIRLYESTNVVEIIYGNNAPSTTTNLDVEVGLRGSSNADFNNRRIQVNNTQWLNNTTTGTLNTDACRTKSTTYPASGSLFRWTPPPACSGTPTGGTAASTPASGAAGSTFTASVTGATAATGLTYQWQSSPNGSAPWTNVAGAVTASSVITSVSAVTTTYYRLAVTCTASGLTGYSTTATYTTTYCTPTGSLDCSSFSDYISNVTINTLNNTTTCSAGGYTLFPATGAQTTTLFQGSSYNLSLTAGPGSGTHGAGVWIDFNQNGLFTDAGEFVSISNSITANATTIVSVPVPGSALTGATRMRIRYAYNQSISGTNSCSVGGSEGETEDYTVTIAAPIACSYPVAQPTSLVLTPTTTTNVPVSFTASATATGYLVVQTLTNTSPSVPADGTYYTVGSSALGGTIVYSGSGTSFSASGLNPGTQYWYWVYAFRDGCIGQPYYLTSGPLTGSATTTACGATLTNSVTFTSAGTYNWSSVTWSLGHVPTPCENVVINYNEPTNGADYVTFNINQAINVKNFTISNTTGNNGLKSIDVVAAFPVVINGDLTISTQCNNQNSEAFLGADNTTIKVTGNTVIGGTGPSTVEGLASFGSYTGTNSYDLMGNVTFNPTGYNYSGGTWNFDATGTQTIADYSIIDFIRFEDLHVGKVNTPTVIIGGGATAPLYVLNNLTVNSGSTLSIPNTFNLNQYNVSNGILTLNSGSTLLLGGATGGQPGSNFPLDFNLISLNPSSTVDYNAGATINQTVYAPVTYGNLTLSNSSNTGNSVKSLTADITGIAGNLTVNPFSSFDLASFSANRTAVGGNFTLNANGSLIVGGTTNGAGPNNNFPANFLLYDLNATSTTTYNSSAAQGLFGGVDYGNLVVDGSNTKTAPAGNLFVKGNFIKSGSSSFAHNNGTVLFNGPATQTFSSTSGLVDFYNLTNNNTTAVDINNDLRINNELLFGSNAKLHLNTGDMIIRSTATATARVASVPAGVGLTYTTGRFNIERYLPSYRAWRFVASPVVKGLGQSPTVREAWQEAGATTADYGTYITGPSLAGTGFDTLSAGYSLKWFDASINNYRGIGNTNDSLVANDAGYMVYVRGDRTVSPTGTTTPTNLRIRGKIRTGDQAFTIPAGSFQSIGNPYASAFSVSDLINNYAPTVLAKSYTAWDPTLNGSYGVGGFQTLSEVDGYQATAAGSAMYIAGDQYPNIESGQAFYLFNLSASPVNVVITEAMKQDGSRLAARENTPADRQFLRTKLYTTSGAIADGNLVAIDDEYDNGPDAWDALKFTNGGENFGVTRYGKKLSVEARGRLQANDTIFYSMSNLREQAYQLQIAPENLASTGMEGYFIDRFLNTQTPVSLAGPTTLNFTVTSNAASKAANRFLLVFKAMAGPLPVTFVSVAAQRQSDRSIAVNWKVANEVNIIKYEVERSGDGTQFNAILSRDAAGMNAYSKTDLSPLASDNFYRIKAIGIGGEITYSAIVKVSPVKAGPSVSIFPNPVTGKKMSLYFTDQPKGLYSIHVNAVNGQLVYQGKFAVNDNNFVQNVVLPENILPGIYQVSISCGEARIDLQNVMIK